jgi:imidazolonepropionase-like amidohydrolase
LIDGNPTQDIRLMIGSANVVVIMKDGKIYKNAP